MFHEHWWRATPTTPRTTNGLAGQITPTDSPARLTAELTDVQLDQVAGGTDGPPTGSGAGNGLNGGKASPLLT
jgi:hypothetical protein